MVVRLTHGKKRDLVTYTYQALGRAFSLTGIAATLKKGWRMVVPDKIPYLLQGQQASFSVGSITQWIIGTLSFAHGQGETETIATPTGYTAGGYFDVDPGGSSLPSSITLNSSTGVLTDSGASVATTSGVVFGYAEPGALPTLTLHGTGASLPYMATVYPLEGVVPQGYVLGSDDDTNLTGTVLSRWPDDSAQVIVLAGQTTVSGSKSLRLKVKSPGAALTTSAITAAVSTVAVNFGTPLSLTITTTNHDWIWWANSQVICARYRLPITNKGDMEAVIDIHAFAGGRAFVEVVIENGKVNADAATVATVATQTYTNATVSVTPAGGSPATIATVSSPSAGMASPRSRIPSGGYSYAGGHLPFRAWYCSTWVGGNPGIDVTHDSASLQAHPFFFKPAAAVTTNLQTLYSQSYDTYEPWAFCRLRMPGMSGGGEDEEIGLITRSQAHYVLTGSKYARKAVIETGKALCSADINWRHTDGTIPTMAQIAGKNTTNGKWPTGATEPYAAPVYGGETTRDGSHIPSVGMVAFLCQPSPCFIELAQKEFCWNATNYNSLNGSHPYDQPRSRAWRTRNYATTIFLTPDSDSARKTGYRAALAAAIPVHLTFADKSWNLFEVFYGAEHTEAINAATSAVGFYCAAFMEEWCMATWNSVDGIKVLRGADATAWSSMVDRWCNKVIRQMNEAQGGEWRLKPKALQISAQDTATATSLDQTPNDWGYWARQTLGATPPPSGGKWLTYEQPNDLPSPTWANAGQVDVAGSGLYYPEIFWNALCVAVERSVSGADAAWAKVNHATNGITNLSTWLSGFATARPELNRRPRNK
jgi:hypothetical protein